MERGIDLDMGELGAIKNRGEKKLFSIKGEKESNDGEAAVYRKPCGRAMSFA